MHFLVTLVYNGEFATNPIAIWQIYFQDFLILAFWLFNFSGRLIWLKWWGLSETILRANFSWWPLKYTKLQSNISLTYYGYWRHRPILTFTNFLFVFWREAKFYINFLGVDCRDYWNSASIFCCFSNHGGQIQAE